MEPLFDLIKKVLSPIVDLLKQHEFMVLFSLVSITLVTGTFFYHTVEGLRYLDALYLSVITLTTVGYGDIAPHTDAGKIFTMIYLIVGVGIILGFVNFIAEHAREKSKINELVLKRQEHIEYLLEKKGVLNKKLKNALKNTKLNVQKEDLINHDYFGKK